MTLRQNVRSDLEQMLGSFESPRSAEIKLTLQMSLSYCGPVDRGGEGGKVSKISLSGQLSPTRSTFVV